MVNTNRIIAKWSLMLREYDFDIVYRKGSENKSADYLSRNFPDSNSEAVLAVSSSLSTPIDEEKDMRKEQEEDSWCSSLLGKEKGFIQEKGLIWKVEFDNFATRKRLCIPVSMRNELLKEWHDSLRCGHLGTKKTYAKMRTRFFWPSLASDIRNYISTCKECQIHRAENQKPVGLLQPIPVADVFERVGIDLLGPLPRTSNGKKHIIVATDYGSRYAVTRAIGDPSAKAVADFLISEIYLKFGTPKTLLSDRGVQFMSGLVQELLKELGTKHTPTTAYHPQCNGLTERMNKTLIGIMNRFIDEDQRNWDKLLPFATFAYNTSVQDTTGATPHFLLFGREVMMDTDRLWKFDKVNHEYNKQIGEIVDVVREKAKQRIENRFNYNKQEYDKNRRESEFLPDQLVLLHRPLQKIGLATKLLPKFIGPFKVLHKLNDVNYVIEDVREEPGRRVIMTTHVSQLRPYYNRPEFTKAAIRNPRVIQEYNENTSEIEQTSAQNVRPETPINDNITDPEEETLSPSPTIQQPRLPTPQPVTPSAPPLREEMQTPTVRTIRKHPAIVITRQHQETPLPSPYLSRSLNSLHSPRGQQIYTTTPRLPRRTDQPWREQQHGYNTRWKNKTRSNKN
jgi:hypothetical protein